MTVLIPPNKIREMAEGSLSSWWWFSHPSEKYEKSQIGQPVAILHTQRRLKTASSASQFPSIKTKIMCFFVFP